MRPVNNKYPITLGYRAKAKFDPKYIHRGIDYGCPQGTQVVATIGGSVIYAADARKSSAGSYGSAYGIQVIVRVGSIYSLYAHLSEVSVKRGDTVRIGDQVGKSGATGNVRGAHLHYQECTSPPSAYTSDRKPQFVETPASQPTIDAVDKQTFWVVDTTTLNGRDFPHQDYGQVITTKSRGSRIASTKEAKVEGKYWNYSRVDNAWYSQEYLERTHPVSQAETVNYRAITDTELRDVPGNGRVEEMLSQDGVFISRGWETYNGRKWVVNAKYQWASTATLIDAAIDTPTDPDPGPAPTPRPDWPDAPPHWYPLADRETQDFSGKYPANTMSTNCVILHSTEGTGWQGYGGGASAPHMTIMPDFKNKKVLVRQHLAGNKSARALENRSGGVETNTANVFQIEMVGTCDPRTHQAWANLDHIYMPDPPQWYIDGVADVLRWVDKQYPKFQIVDGAPRGWGAYPGSYGATKYRMTDAEWGRFYGIAGHSHVPENAHGDPGNFPIQKLISSAKEQAPTAAPPTPTPTPEPTPDPQQPGGSATVRVGGLNVGALWLANWSTRVPLLAKVRDSLSASILITQESGYDKNGNELSKAIGWNGRAETQKDIRFHMTDDPRIGLAIHRDPQKYKELEGGKFRTIGPHHDWAVWSLLRHLETGVITMYVGTHLEHLPKGSNNKHTSYDDRREAQMGSTMKQAKELARKAATKYGVGYIYTIIQADCNGELGDAYDGPGKAATKYGFRDAEKIARKHINTVKGTFNDFGPFDKGDRIDRFFVENGLVVEELSTVYTKISGRFATDHNGVAIVVTTHNNKP